MKVDPRPLLAALFLIAAAACGPRGDSAPEPEGIPQDEAFTTERKLIDQKVLEITEIAKDLGFDEGFKDVPIVVTSAQMPLLAYCRTDGSRRGKVIVVGRKAFAPSKKNFDKLFGVLLHEIGHCYFKRDHDKRVLQQEKKRVVIRIPDSETKKKKFARVAGPFLPISIMYTGEGNLQFANSPELKKYYVAELVGQSAAQTLGDLSSKVKSKTPIFEFEDDTTPDAASLRQLRGEHSRE